MVIIDDRSVMCCVGIVIFMPAPVILHPYMLGLRAAAYSCAPYRYVLHREGYPFALYRQFAHAAMAPAHLAMDAAHAAVIPVDVAMDPAHSAMARRNGSRLDVQIANQPVQITDADVQLPGRLGHGFHWSAPPLI